MVAGWQCVDHPEAGVQPRNDVHHAEGQGRDRHSHIQPRLEVPKAAQLLTCSSFTAYFNYIFSLSTGQRLTVGC